MSHDPGTADARVQGGPSVPPFAVRDLARTAAGTFANSAAHFATFNRLGYAVIEGALSPELTAHLRAAVDQVWEAAKRGTPAPIRVYEDYPHWLGGINVAGIEDPFHTIPAFKSALASMQLDSILSELTGWPGAQMEVARVHVNDRYRYQGFWHRDASPASKARSVVAVIYLRDEAGFRIAPADSQLNAVAETGDRLQAEHSLAQLPDEHVVDARAGDILLMQSYLLHRGYNNAKRSHLHLRFIPGDDYDVRQWAEFRNTDFARYVPRPPVARLRNLAGYVLPKSKRSNLWQR